MPLFPPYSLNSQLPLTYVTPLGTRIHAMSTWGEPLPWLHCRKNALEKLGKKKNAKTNGEKNIFFFVGLEDSKVGW